MSMGTELRIAVVDDMEQDRVQIMEETDAILSRAQITHSIDCYADAEALLDAIQGGRKYPLLLLDVLMDEMDGMALAAELRKEGDPAAIIFISLSQVMARRGYKVEASRYLTKPLDQEELKEALLYCHEKWRDKKEILIPTFQGQHRTSFSDIQFVEAFDRGTRFVLSDETVESRLKFSQAEALLPKSSFILCHRAYIVNLAFTKRIRPYEFTMKSGAAVPVSRLRYNEINRQFMNFFRD